MRGIGMKEIRRRALRGFAWMGNATLFCLGLLVMVAVILVAAVLTPVMLAAAVLPSTARGKGQGPRDRRGSGTASQLPPRKILVS